MSAADDMARPLEVSASAVRTATTARQLTPGQEGAIWLNAGLWQAGQVLTSGAFLTYFAADLGASREAITVLLALPELVGLAGLFARPLWQWTGRRRQLWLLFSLIARLLTFCIPAISVLHFAAENATTGESATSAVSSDISSRSAWLLIVVLGLAQAAQAISTTLYFSWMADLVPPRDWGRLFARRNIAILLTLATVTIAAAWVRDVAKARATAEGLWIVYTVIFTTGGLLLLASMWPLLRLPHPAGFPGGLRKEGVSAAVQALPDGTSVPRGGSQSAWDGTLVGILTDRSARWLLAHSWCLGLANGMTQAAFFLYQTKVLGLTLAAYQGLLTLMNVCQMMTSLWAGRCRTAADHRRVLMVSTLTTAMALPFWMAAASDWRWLIGAFVCWGAFGAVNVAGPNLMLCRSLPGDNAMHFALFRQVAGVLAGISGLIGGLVLTQLLATERPLMWGGITVSAYHLLFAVSWIGRLIAGLLVWPVDRDRSSFVADVPGDGPSART